MSGKIMKIIEQGNKLRVFLFKILDMYPSVNVPVLYDSNDQFLNGKGFAVFIGSVVFGEFSKPNGYSVPPGTAPLKTTVLVEDPVFGKLYLDMTMAEWANIVQAADPGGIAQINSDWIAASGVAEILNKPSVVTNPLGGDLDFGGYKGIGAANPTSDQDVATKSYVDNFVNGLKWKNIARVATDAALPTSTYNNGAGTITADAVGILSVDGENIVLGDDILVFLEVDRTRNGIYTCTTEGTGGVAFVLTRADLANTGTELVNAAVAILEGATYGGKAFTQITPSPITLGTSDIVWTTFLNSIYSAGTGTRIGSGNTINVKLSEGVTGGQSVKGGTAANDTLTITGSISTDPRTTTAPAIRLKTDGPLGASTAINQVLLELLASVNASGSAGFTILKLVVIETAVGSGAKNLIEILGGVSGVTPYFVLNNIGQVQFGKSITLSGATSGSVTLQAADLTTDYTSIMPSSAGVGALTRAVDGTLTWTPVSGGGGGGGSVSIDALTAATPIDILDAPGFVFDGSLGTLQRITLEDDRNFTISNLKVGIRYTFVVRQDATGGRVLTWDTPVVACYGGAGAPPITSSANGKDIYELLNDGIDINVLSYLKFD